MLNVFQSLPFNLPR